MQAVPARLQRLCSARETGGGAAVLTLHAGPRGEGLPRPGPFLPSPKRPGVGPGRAALPPREEVLRDTGIAAPKSGSELMRSRSMVRRRRRGRAVATVGTVVLAAGAAAAAAVGFGGGGPAAPAAPDLPPGTAQVTRQTMLDTEAVPGQLGYGAAATLAGRISGVITKVPLAGAVIRRGRPIYRVDNQPVVLMYGDIAAYRTLGLGAPGADGRQLERNLKALAYRGFTVDDMYTAATATAVEQWQKDLGLPQTGQVELGRVLFAPGKIRIASVM